MNAHKKNYGILWELFPFQHFHDSPRAQWARVEKYLKNWHAYEFAFGSEVAKTAKRMLGTSHLNVFLKSICEQNSIS